MDEQLTTAAKTLARWCYARGVDERVLGCGEQLLKAAVDQALGRPAPAHLEHALWQQTATLLGQRRDWDRDHQVSGRTPAACLLCVVARDRCPDTPGAAVARALASCTGSSSTRASTPIRAATAPVSTDPWPSSSAPRSCWEPRCWHSRPESARGATTRLSRGDRSHPWSALRRPRRTGAAGAGPRDPWEFT